MIDSIEPFTLQIPFKVAFKHASAERKSTQTVWVEARASDGSRGCGEGCPREYVTAESLGSAGDFIHAHSDEWRRSLNDFAALRQWVENHGPEIDAHPAAWTAVELAVLDVFGKMTRRSVESLLGLPELTGRYRYTAVVGDASPELFRALVSNYVKAGFRQFKIKLSGDGERDRAKVEALTGAGIRPGDVRADANNLWPDAETAIDGLRRLEFRFFALEEPLRPGDVGGMRKIAQTLDMRIVLDESALRAEQLHPLSADANRWLVNIRVSKMGGLLRSLRALHEATSLGIGVIVGAHVGETSVLSRAALVIAARAGTGLVAQEGAFGTHLIERDVVARPIMFGRAGVLDASALGSIDSTGLGLAVSSDLPLKPLRRETL